MHTRHPHMESNERMQAIYVNDSSRRASRRRVRLYFRHFANTLRGIQVTYSWRKPPLSLSLSYFFWFVRGVILFPHNTINHSNHLRSYVYASCCVTMLLFPSTLGFLVFQIYVYLFFCFKSCGDNCVVKLRRIPARVKLFRRRDTFSVSWNYSADTFRYRLPLEIKVYLSLLIRENSSLNALFSLQCFMFFLFLLLCPS